MMAKGTAGSRGVAGRGVLARLSRVAGQSGAAVWRGRLAVAFGSLLGVIAADLFLVAPQPRHRATVEIAAPAAPETLGATPHRDAAGPRETALIGTEAVVGPVAERLASARTEAAAPPPGSAPARARAVARLSDRLTALWQAETGRIRVIAEGASPAEATRLAALVAESYLTHWQARRDAAERWLGARAERLAAEARAARERVAEIADRLPAGGLDLRRRQLAQLRERAASLDTAIAELDRPTAEARAARDALLFTRAADIVGDPALSEIASSILQGVPGGALPEIAIARFDAALERRLAGWAASRARLADERRTLTGLIADWEAERARERALADRLARARRQAAESARTHRAVADQLAARAEAAAAAAPRIARPAAALPAPQAGASRPSRLLAGGAAGGLLAGLGVLALAGRRGRAARLGDLAARTGLAALGTVPGMPCSPAGARAVLRALGNGSPFGEGLAAVRAGLALPGGALAPKIVAVAAGPEAATARMAAALGLARLARLRGRRVAVIECDAEASRLRPAFGLAATPGLAALLGGSAAYHEVLHIDRPTGLHLVPGGPEVWSSGFDDARLAECMQLLRRTYDEVYVDLPLPAAPARLAALLGPHDALLALHAAGAPAGRADLARLAPLGRLDIAAAGLALYRPAPAEVETATPHGTEAGASPAHPPAPAPAPVDAAEEQQAPAAGEEAPPNVLYMASRVQEAR